MKRLGLLRHAKSDWDDASVRDFDRGLNARGRRGAALIGRHIANCGIAWERVIASPATRIRATLAASGLPYAPNFDDRVYLAEVATLLDLLRHVDGDPASILLVGHNPGLHELLFRLVDPDAEGPLLAAAAEKFPTAAFAVLELPIAAWADLQADNARLVELTRPRDLDPELGPERVR